MFKTTAKGKGQASGYGTTPKALQNKAKYVRRRCRSAPTYRVYGPPKRKDRFLLDMKLLRHRCPELVRDVEKKQKEKEEDEKKVRIPEKDAVKLPQLTVKKINFHVQGKSGGAGKPDVPGNAVKHHTEDFSRCLGEDPQPVFRRGQEFKITITFDRPYNLKQDDLILYVEADEGDPGKSLSTNFKLDEQRDKPFTEGQHWAARIIKRLPEKNAMKLAIYIPGTCPIGEWDMKVKTRLRDNEMTCVYEHPVSFVVLFNPWSKQDQVYYTGDQEDLKEYILKDTGFAYYGTAGRVNTQFWRYGQFDKDILEVCLAILRKAFGSKMTSAMGDAITVSRALTKIVNSPGDDGVLVGNWTGTFGGGVSPGKWMSSANVLKQYHDEGEPVKYGQCWVFSHVLTAVCRALGIPCRSVTNFDSAHDTDGSCSIDFYYNADGTEDKFMKKDSIWNFHVWNEVWLLRPDIEELDCNGWHTIDATPQEQSEGTYQCGPCPVAAVKRGLIYLGYDTAFVFAEVNADVVHWMETPDLGWKVTAIKKKSVGREIVTKAPNAYTRLNLIHDYKFPEDTEEERQAVKRAVRQTSRGQDMYVESANIDVSFGEDPQAKMGDDLNVKVLVKNTSQVPRVVDLLMSARSCSYWNDPDTAKEICQAKVSSLTIGPGCTETVPFTVAAHQYMDKSHCVHCMYVYVRCVDQATNMPYTAQEPFEVTSPELIVKDNKRKSKPREVVTVTATFTNPLDVTLTNCEMLMAGEILPGGPDKDKYTNIFGMFSKKHEDIVGKKRVTLKFNMYWDEEDKEKDDDEDSDDGEEGVTPEERKPKKATKTQTLEFFCDQLESMSATFTTICVRP